MKSFNEFMLGVHVLVLIFAFPLLAVSIPFHLIVVGIAEGDK